MAYKINDNCISCGACEAECPVGAISAGDGKFVIDPEICISCGACANVCPVGALSQEQQFAKRGLQRASIVAVVTVGARLIWFCAMIQIYPRPHIPAFRHTIPRAVE